MSEKLTSRKFLFTLLWNVFVIIALISTIILKKDLSFIGNLITFAGTITAAYIGLQGYIDSKNSN
jgi:hypothetical protein